MKIEEPCERRGENPLRNPLCATVEKITADNKLMLKFIKFIIIPLTIMIVTTVFVVYNPTWKMGTILFMIAVSISYGSSIYSYYYLFCKIFPDPRNAEIPPQITMMIKIRNKEDLNKEELAIARKTIAFNLTALFTMLTICLGAYLWYTLPEKYLNAELAKENLVTTGVVISSRRVKNDIGDHKTYSFTDISGNEYTDYLKSDELNVGDSLIVTYSKLNPSIHKAWKK